MTIQEQLPHWKQLLSKCWDGNAYSPLSGFKGTAEGTRSYYELSAQLITYAPEILSALDRSIELSVNEYWTLLESLDDAIAQCKEYGATSKIPDYESLKKRLEERESDWREGQ